MEYVTHLYILLSLHAIGDYLLQTDFIAKTKSNNWWHLVVHCLLYTVPFWLYFGFNWKLLILLFMHFMIDAAKCRWHNIDYTTDQLSHIIVMLMLYLIL